MSVATDRIIRRARSLAGTPFRPQGRDPSSGLDCVGLVLRVFAIPAQLVRRDYRLRGRHSREIQVQLDRFFHPVPFEQGRPGDVLLCVVAADQMHLAIDCGGSFIHADARLRRIVETPSSPQWPIAGIYRRRYAGARSN